MADNCEPRTIESNKTGLSFAETICGRLPTIEVDGFLPTWYELEPNSYSDFGAGITTVARRPINASRQNKKGVITDLDANGGFNSDFLQTSLNRLLSGFFFADYHEKATTAPMDGVGVTITGAVASTDTFTAAAGLDRFRVGQLVKVSGFTIAANNGAFRVLTVTPTAISVDAALTDETASAGVKIEAIGFQFAASGASVVLVGNLARLTLAANPVAATGVLTITSAEIPDDGDTVEVGGLVYTFKTVAAVAYDVPIGVDDDTSATNFAAAINGGVLGTPANDQVSAVAAANAVTLTARIKGISGNLIATDATGDNIAFGGAALTGGTGLSLLETTCQVGEWVYLGGDATAEKLGANVGYARIGAITDTTMTFDKTTFTPAASVGTGQTARLYIGNMLRNEKDPDLIITKYYEFERTLGKDADGAQAEYLTRSVAGELTLNLPTAEMISVDLTYTSADREDRTGAEGRKPGPFVPALGEAPFNTTSNIVRTRMSILDPATSMPTPLFAYITEATLTINNNLSAVKAIGFLGAIDVTAGNFDVAGDVTALFSTVAATRAVRNNASVTYDIIAASANAGFVYDIPLLSLGNGLINIEAGSPVTLPLSVLGAENPFGYTLLYTNFPYLPDIAMPVAVQV